MFVLNSFVKLPVACFFVVVCFICLIVVVVLCICFVVLLPKVSISTTFRFCFCFVLFVCFISLFFLFSFLAFVSVPSSRFSSIGLAITRTAGLFKEGQAKCTIVLFLLNGRMGQTSSADLCCVGHTLE